ncbi:MAG: hypothetical protein M0P12_04525 [Paludibacteraceae bacterium]|nr:hypothetical protein [Paludibacteraceae bacterium]
MNNKIDFSKALPIGTVLSIDSYKGYWKIIGVPFENIRRWVSYPVKKCSKTGKEFRETSGFSFDAIHRNLENGTTKIITSVGVGTKADIDNGILEGKKKRRIQYLKARIENMQKELASLENQTT